MLNDILHMCHYILVIFITSQSFLFLIIKYIPMHIFLTFSGQSTDYHVEAFYHLCGRETYAARLSRRKSRHILWWSLQQSKNHGFKPTFFYFFSLLTPLYLTLLYSTLLYSTLLHLTLLSSTLLCSTPLCCVLRYSVVFCATLLCSTLLCCVPHYSVVFHATLLCSTLLCCVPCYSVVFHATLLCSTLLCCVPRYSVCQLYTAVNNCKLISLNVKTS